MASPWPDLAGRLVEGGHVLPVRVYYENTDFTGIVYHAEYLKFFERGRSDFLRLCGVRHRELAGEGDGFPELAFTVRRLEIDYLKPAKIDDVLEVRTRMDEQRGARLVLIQEIWRDDELLTSAKVLVVVINVQGRPTRLPLTLAEQLKGR